MRLAEHAVLVQRELLAGAELAAARVAREARQVVDLLARLAHPVRRRDAAAALGALGTEAPAQTHTSRWQTDNTGGLTSIASHLPSLLIC